MKEESLRYRSIQSFFAGFGIESFHSVSHLFSEVLSWNNLKNINGTKKKLYIMLEFFLEVSIFVYIDDFAFFSIFISCDSGQLNNCLFCLSVFLVWRAEHSSNGIRGGVFCSSAYYSISFHPRNLILLLKDRRQNSYLESIAIFPILILFFPKYQKTNLNACRNPKNPKKYKSLY